MGENSIVKLMEFERTIFRIHERTLKSPSCPDITNACLILFAFLCTPRVHLAVTLSTAFLYGQLRFANDSMVIKNSLMPGYEEIIQPEDILVIAVTLGKDDAGVLRNAYLRSKGDMNASSIYSNETTNGVISMYFYAQDFQVLNLPSDIK
eukprot:TRINITY_DN11274_c0_g2_i4.p2 TRINITY_DN11274_c0_g2~~TRINITY_DN11274_c0_g2_i4.p2  ORF type:complete len:150 (-),score=27.62 TRINITY_DN11274_c0_g2_i4:573-1022(-)